MALQLTNIIRDVRADLSARPLYLPTEDLARFGVSEDDLRAGVGSPLRSSSCFGSSAIAHAATIARAAGQLPPDDARSLVAAEIMGGIYFEILSASSATDTTSSARAFAFRARSAPSSRFWLVTLQE